MSIKMFVYMNVSDCNKAIAKHFNVRRKSLPKVVATTGISDLGCYDAHKNVLYVNHALWDLCTEFQKYDLFIHELVHMYQHIYSLCEFDYILEHDKRPQEIHCMLNTRIILESLNIKEEAVAII